MPRGASAKRKRQYQKLRRSFQKSGRYKGRQEEVAARIVNKQRRELGETKSQQRMRKEGRMEDRVLPIRNYREKTIPEISKRLDRLSKPEIRKIRDFEKSHKARKTLLEKLDRHLKAA